MNDQQASQLISKSLSQELSPQEASALQQHLSQSPQVRALAKLSSLIQKSMAENAVQPPPGPDTTDASDNGSQGQAPAEGLSPLSKERMRRTLREAQASTTDDSQLRHLHVAQTETTYYTGAAPEASVEHRQSLTRFSLIRKLGEGGLGTVWLARDDRLRRSVALKEMKIYGTGQQNIQRQWKRFEREAEITAHLEHPNVVPLYMSGIHPESGLPFYAMRFVGKQTLADAIEEYHARRQHAIDDPIHLHRLLNAFLDVCQAIAFAHSRGVIHRDLKPENVALDHFGQVLVLDWGLAKVDTDGELATRLALDGSVDDSALAQTLDGDVVGTPLYMAPEQAAGDMHHLDERTDVYGLGAILFAILTGSAPHQHSQPPENGSRTIHDMLKSIVHSDLPNPRDLNPAVPRDLEAICLRALSTQRFARHASAEELAGEVERWIAGRHQRQAHYDAMRMIGRDLKSRLCVQLRQLAVTAQFIVELPPIQGLLASHDTQPEEFREWRDRLSKVLLALAKAKVNLTGLSYAQIRENRIHEMLRIERSLRDGTNVQSLPLSRLRRGAANTFHKTILEQFPGESCIDFDYSTAGVVRLVAGVPVFDSATEEPFGLVLAEVEIGKLTRSEIQNIELQDTLYLIDDKQQILFSTKPATHDRPRMAEEEITRWPEISRALAEQGEYVETDREYYATRLVFPQKNNSIRIVLKSN